MNIEKVCMLTKEKIYICGKTDWLKRKLEQWFPTTYAFRVVRTRIVVEQVGDNYVSTESYDIIEIWEAESRNFGRRCLAGHHRLQLPEYTSDGWISFTYELQRRPGGNWNARWKSLGYLRYTRVS